MWNGGVCAEGATILAERELMKLLPMENTEWKQSIEFQIAFFLWKSFGSVSDQKNWSCFHQNLNRVCVENSIEHNHT